MQVPLNPKAIYLMLLICITPTNVLIQVPQEFLTSSFKVIFVEMHSVRKMELLKSQTERKTNFAQALHFVDLQSPV